MIIFIVAVLVCAPFLWWFMVLRKNKLTDVIPGPRTLPVLGSALDVGNTPQQFLQTIIAWRNKYGGFYKFYIANELRVLISNPDLMEQVMSSNTHISKSNAYDLLKSWLGDGLLISTGKKWKTRRKLITPTFHFKILDQFLEIFNSCGEVLISKLAEEVGKNSTDVYPYINLYSLDIICETSMGVKVLAQEGQNGEYVDAVRGFLDIFMKRTFSVWKRSDLLFKLSDAYTLYKQYLKILHQFTNNVIRKRRAEKSGEKSGPNISDDGIRRKIALLDMLLESEDNNTLSNEDIREEIDTFMFEGHDTTTSGMAFAIFCLAENQDVQEKVYEEIVSVVGDQEKLTMQHLQDTKYLDMVIKEVQRLYPSVPVIERLLEAESTIGDYKLPKDIYLTLFIYAMHRDERYFSNPEKFDPNRFLPENQSQRHNYAYVPFSAGPRNCIGQKFAMLEMKATIIKVVRSFRLLAVPNHKLDLGFAAVLKSYNGVLVRLQHRDAI